MAHELTEFSVRVAGAIKAELARRDLSGNDLVEVLGIGRNAVYARLRSDRPFDTEDIDKVVAFLGITIDTLFASADLGVAA